ncbi:hypothetical protein N0V82_002144 [Gnomoniopsis sp. IMI 355080]|nr:hypothetical protein N0V82_002144 [Gnomoniopsis sp. IMI 355080]
MGIPRPRPSFVAREDGFGVDAEAEEDEEVGGYVVTVEIVVADDSCRGVLAMLLRIEFGDPVEEEDEDDELVLASDELLMESVDVVGERESSIVITSDGVSEMTCSLRS